jgi:aspartyl-tRNA(Asn)/glutamyl-tRNA(Gln) amidotransferase subunit A
MGTVASRDERRLRQRAWLAEHNDVLNAVVDEVQDHERRDGPLAGLSVTVKANIARRGRPLDAASAVLDGHRAPDHARGDATCVVRLREAGAVVVGTTNMDEFGMGGTTERSLHGPTKNPWDTTRSAGGSSGGAAAAVAAGFCDAALGTDTGGSVRQPAAFCGVVGFKPTYGRISRRGVVAFASSLDQVGVLARDVDTVADVARVVCSPDDGDATTVDNPLPDLHAPLPAGLRVGVLRSLLGEGVDDDIVAAVSDAAAAFAAAGARVTDVVVPHIEHAVATYYVIATAEASSNLSRYDGVRFGPRGDDAGLEGLYTSTRAHFGPEVKRRILLGTFVLSHGFYEAYLLQAQKVRALLRDAFTEVFRDVDVLLLPTTPTLPPTLGSLLGDPLAMYKADLFTLPASLAGLPAISVPTTTARGLPVAVQLIGRAYDEGTLLSAARVVARPLACPMLCPDLDGEAP